jgi:hypothetical protein
MARIQDQGVYALGIVNTSPMLLWPGASGQASFRMDFSSLRMYATCQEASNLAPEPLAGTLTHYDYRKPGFVVYRFQVPPGTRLDQATLSLRLSSSRSLGLQASDSKISVCEARGDESFTEVATLDRSDFFQPDGTQVAAEEHGRLLVDKEFSLKVPGRAGEGIAIRIGYGPVRQAGVIEVAGLELHAKLAGMPQGPGLARMQFDHVAKNVRLIRWRPGVSLVGADGLHAFSQDDRRNGTTPESPWNPASDLEGFLAEHPGAKPVASIGFPDGRPAYSFYDPALADPYLTLHPDEPRQVVLGTDAPVTFTHIKLAGGFDHPRLLIDGQALDLGIQAPPGSELMLFPGGEGALRFEPAFTGADEILSHIPEATGLRKNSGEDCLSCGDASPCGFTVHLSSHMPLTALRVTAYPRIFADREGRNRVRISFSLDGKTFETLDELTSDGSGLWEGLMDRRVSVKRFSTPARDVSVRFELTGSGAQLWSPADRRMRIEALLNVSALAPPAISTEEPTVVLHGNGNSTLGLLLAPEAAPTPHGLQSGF